MNIKSPAIEIIIHRNRLSGEAELRLIRGCIRAALVDKAQTKHDGKRFVTVVKHSDVAAYLVDDELLTAEELTADSGLPIALITTV